MKAHLQQPQSVHHLQQQVPCRLLLQMVSPRPSRRLPRCRGLSQRLQPPSRWCWGLAAMMCPWKGVRLRPNGGCIPVVLPCGLLCSLAVPWGLTHV